MTDRDLNSEWARSQIEAWADGSLVGESLARMNAVLANDPRLKAAAERAVAVRRALREPRAEPMPGGLRNRLLAIPAREPRHSTYWWALPAAAAAVAIVAVAVALGPTAPPPTDPRVAAVQEFELAMRYLRDSASVTQVDVTTVLGAGLQEALIKSRDSLERTTNETGG
jgi:anti-sigma factor RsiW